MAIGYTSMLVALTTVFLGIKHQRDAASGGVIEFRPAFGVGLAISIVAGIFMSWPGSWYWPSPTWISPAITPKRNRPSQGQRHRRRRAREAGGDMEDFRRNYANPVYRMAMTFTEIAPVGLLVSLVSAALLRNSRFLAARR